MSSKDGGDGGSWHVDDAAAELDSKAEMPVDSAAAEHREEASEEYDPLRDGPARYLGYANEVGESFRPRFPRFVGPSYAISWSYVVADCYDKGVKAHAKSQGLETQSAEVMQAVVETAVWQGFASVIIPGLVINQTVLFSQSMLPRLHPAVMNNPVLMRWGPTAIGLAVIPFIVAPIDQSVHFGLDRVLRPWLDDLVSRTGSAK